MTVIHRGRIDHPGAWCGPAIGGKEGLIHRLGPDHLDAFDRLLERSRGREPKDITRADFDHPAVNALMAAARDAVMEGHGAIILSGVDLKRYSPAELSRLFWGLGTHLGNGVVQGYRGDHVAQVRVDPTGPWRGTTTDMELRPHTDFHEILALAAVSRAESGGLSGLVSSLAVHNAIEAGRPDLLAPLYRGFYHESEARRIRSDRPVPIFCCVEGKVSCFYNLVFMRRAAESMGVELPADLREAIAFFDAQAARPDLRLDFVLEPGEMVFWHNFTVLHSRTAFKDSAEHRRLLLRLWLNVPNGRPLAPEIRERARIMDADHARYGLGGPEEGLAGIGSRR